MSFKKIVIAIDGYSACGKSSTAKRVAKILGYSYIDSGAMYRAVTHYFLENFVSLTNPKAVSAALASIKINFVVNSDNETEIFLNGLNVEREIRKMKVSDHVSQVSALREVRTAMVSLQRKLGKERGVVMDGRDIGTVVFPDAELKVFMTADMGVRAFRRQQEFLEKGKLVDLADVIENIRMRDEIDTTREESPLRKASNAIEIDTTHITLAEQVEEVIRLSVSRILSPYHVLNR
jgi:cytidylate kinase